MLENLWWPKQKSCYLSNQIAKIINACKLYAIKLELQSNYSHHSLLIWCAQPRTLVTLATKLLNAYMLKIWFAQTRTSYYPMVMNLMWPNQNSVYLINHTTSRIWPNKNSGYLRNQTTQHTNASDFFTKPELCLHWQPNYSTHQCLWFYVFRLKALFALATNLLCTCTICEYNVPKPGHWLP